MSNANKPAFPSEPRSFAPPDSFGSGLSKREYFAAMALQGLMAMPTRDGEDIRYESYARAAVKQADALLAELDKSKESA